MSGTKWTWKETNALRDGWKNGMSMQAIADWVDRSREAVAGKIHRMKLTLPKAERVKRQRASAERLWKQRKTRRKAVEERAEL